MRRPDRTIQGLAAVWLLATPLGAAVTSSLSQYGITWTFDRAYEFGQYVNGDYWVVGPVTIVGISPQPIRGSGTGRNGSMVNPRFARAQGYDGRSRVPDQSYDANVCVLPPVTLNPGDTIVSTKSCPSKCGGFTFVQSAAILTVVDTPQTPDRFRPPYTRPSRVQQSASDPYSFSKNRIRWNLLPKLSRARLSTVPPLSSTSAKAARAWLFHVSSWFGVDTMPRDNMRGYGQWIAEDLSEVSLQLVLDYTDEELTPLLIGMLQVGIDTYGVYEDGGRWLADGGIFQGRKWPLLFAGIMFDHARMRSPSLKTGDRHRFQEDGQTYYFDDPGLPAFTDNRGREVAANTPGAFKCRGERGWIDKTNGGPGDTVLWRIRDYPIPGFESLTHEHLHVNNWNSDRNVHVKWESYRRANTSMSWVGYALAARLMNAKALWGHDAFFDYVDRWMTQDDTNARNAYRARFGEPGYFPGQGRTNLPFVNEMWNEYRDSSPSPPPPPPSGDTVAPAAPTSLRVVR